MGGGTLFLDKDVYRKFKGDVVLYLHVEPDTLYGRIIRNGIPAFFDSSNPRQSFDKLYSERLPLYKKLSDIVIDNSGDAEETIKNILLGLKKRNGGQ